MERFGREQIKVWLRRLAALTALAVGLLSWFGGVPLIFIILRMGLAFTVIYGLGMGGLFLFEQGAAKDTAAAVQDKGSLIDIAVGEQAAGLQEEAYVDGERYVEPAGSGSSLGAPGNLGSPGSQGQIGGRLPGQVKQNLRGGLPDIETQADIVRRMGWENSADS